MRALFVIFLAISSPVLGGDADILIGTWKLVSWQVIVENEPPQDVFGSHPKGFLILTREGRSIVLTTAENRQAGMSDTERASLHKSMLAYSGRYRIEGHDFITTVEVSWNEAWNGTEQRRHFRVEGDKLFIESAPAPSILFPGKTEVRRVVWERESEAGGDCAHVRGLELGRKAEQIMLAAGNKLAAGQDDKATVTRLLNDYARAFGKLDVQAILPYYFEPSVLITPQGVAAMPTHAALPTVFAPLMEGLRVRGYARSEFTALSGATMLVSGVAVRYKADGQELERIGATYVLHKTENGWKIAVAVAHDVENVVRLE